MSMSACPISLTSFPGPHAAFSCLKECEGPGMFPHIHDVDGRKVVERTYVIERGQTGVQNSKKS